MKRKVNHFTDEFRFQVIQEYLNTNKSKTVTEEVWY